MKLELADHVIEELVIACLKDDIQTLQTNGLSQDDEYFDGILKTLKYYMNYQDFEKYVKQKGFDL
jgi:hypothetical protein